MYKHVECTLDEWRAQVKALYPSATIHKAPEELGGTRDAYVDGTFVGDWDGSESPQGRILTS